MLSQADLQRALTLALGEFGPSWKIVGDCVPVDPFDPGHWGAGSHSYQVTLRHRVTGHLKVPGRRVAYEPGASLHPAVALSLIEAYRHGNAEPLRRYLEEIGVAATMPGTAAHFFRQPVPVAAPVPDGGTLVSDDGDVPSPASRSRVPTFRRLIDARPKWSSLSTSRRRREPPPPPLPAVAPRASAPAPPVEPRRRMFSRLRRELELWQWRRANGTDYDKSTYTNY